MLLVIILLKRVTHINKMHKLRKTQNYLIARYPLLTLNFFITLKFKSN